jgi:uncharacterized protein (DUF1015 family)
LPEITPFPGIRYNPEAIEDFSLVVAPPYDVIDPDQHAELLSRDPFNVVRLILGSNPSSPGDYAKEARTMNQWLSDGVLKRDPEPRYYLIEDSFYLPGKKTAYRRWGIIGRVRLEPLESGRIFPHERTHQGPKEDRLRLMKAFGGNLSQVFTLFDGDASTVRSVLGPVFNSRPVMDITDRDGIDRRLWVIDAPDIITTVSGLLRDRNLYIADGHHRYETALTYAKEMEESDPVPDPQNGYNFIMMALVGMEDPGLAILPTHRLLHSFENFDFNNMLDCLSSTFTIDPLDTESDMDVRSGKPQTELGGRGFILYDLDADRFLRALLREDVDLGARMPGISPPVRELEVTLAEQFLMKECLGMTPEQISHQEHIDYFKDLDQAMVRVKNEGQLLAVMPPTSMADLVAVTSVKERMPQKSTFFYPKLLSGLVFYDHGSGE